MEHIASRFNFIVNIFFSNRCPPPPRYKWFLWIYCKEQNRTSPMPWAQNVTGTRSWDPRDQSPGRRPSWNLCTDTVSSGSDVVAPAVPISRYPLQKKKCLNEACLQRIFRFRRQLVQTIGICEVSESHKTTIEMCLFTNCGRLLKQSCVTFYHYRLYCSHGFALITRCKTDKVIVFIGIKLNRNFRCLVEKKVLCPS